METKKIAVKLDDLQNKMEIIKSLASVLFFATDSKANDWQALSGALFLLNTTTQEAYQELECIKKELFA